MILRGFEHRATDLARGVLVIRAKRDLEGAEQHVILHALAEANMTALPEGDNPQPTPRRLLAFPWAPPDRGEVDEQRALLDRLDETFGFEEIVCFKVETAVDGATWSEPSRDDAKPLPEDLHANDPNVSDDDDDEPAGEILFSSADASATIQAQRERAVTRIEDDELDTAHDVDESGLAEEDDLDDPEDADLTMAASPEPKAIMRGREWGENISFWRNGPPPIERDVAFPVENNPSLLDDEAWEEFGLAVKLAGEECRGEESVVNAFFALWLSVFQDERAADFQVFENAHVVHDRTHRSAMLWVDRFQIPVDVGELSGFLLWIVARLNEVIPLVWVRFDPTPAGERYPIEPDDSFVLAGNPLAERYTRSGEEVALNWAESQTLWSKRELGAMLVELALERDPDDPDGADEAERLLEKARQWDPHSDAISFLLSVWVRQGKLAHAKAICDESGDARLLAQLLAEVAEHASDELVPTLAAAGRDALSRLTDDAIGELTQTIAEHAKPALAPWLAALPYRSALIPHLYNASFHVSRELALDILERTIAMPEPIGDDTARTAYLRAWNNACIHAHAQGEIAKAVRLAERGEVHGTENPHIFHAAACAYSAAGQTERALGAVRAAISAGYEHLERLEVDGDLGDLLHDARFLELFEEWRGGRADLN